MCGICQRIKRCIERIWDGWMDGSGRIDGKLRMDAWKAEDGWMES